MYHCTRSGTNHMPFMWVYIFKISTIDDTVKSFEWAIFSEPSHSMRTFNHVDCKLYKQLYSKHPTRSGMLSKIL